MWTNENRARYDRSRLRYPSDLTDDEWQLVEPLIPPGRRGGDKRTVIMREAVNGLMYILSTGCQWRAIPIDLPPRSTFVARRINRSPPYMGHLKSSANSWCFLFRATRTGDWVVIGRRR